MFSKEHKFKIVIEAKSATEMRMRTGADYHEVSMDEVHIDIVDTGNWRMNFLLAAHGFIEYILVKASGIPIKDIEEFDKNFELDRASGIHGIHSEPGDQPDCPYASCHSVATGVERLMAVLLRVNWADFASVVDNKVLPRITKHQQAPKRR